MAKNKGRGVMAEYREYIMSTKNEGRAAFAAAEVIMTIDSRIEQWNPVEILSQLGGRG